ncbi:MAG: hypothetical protein GY797_28660 [Deltaproteobacteria bacterium]|nr:hypothetical protein [Deltaproteobacteria bacterium]
MSDYRETKDYVKAICEGKGKRFNGVVCDYYEDRECILLREHRMEEFWDEDKGRCAGVIFIIAEGACLKKFREWLPIGDSKDDLRDYPVIYDMQGVIKRLKEVRLTSAYRGLPTWLNYVRKTLCWEIGKAIGVIPKEKECGKCQHFSANKELSGKFQQDIVSVHVCLEKRAIQMELMQMCPAYTPNPAKVKKTHKQKCSTCIHLSGRTYFCYQKREPRNKTAEACDEYNGYIPKNFVSLDDDSPLDPEKDKRIRDSLLFEIQETLDKLDELDEYNAAPDKNLRKEDELECIRQLLEDRITQESISSDKRNCYERQIDIFFGYLQLASEGFSKGKIIKSLANMLHLQPKTIRQDWREIMQFLREHAEKCA